MANEQTNQSQETEGEGVKNLISTNQSQLATILIGLLVVVAGFLTYNYLQSRQTQNTTGKVSNGAINQITPTGSEQITETKGLYVVKAGDTLSSIAEQIYGNSQNWREIAQANDIPLEQPVIKVGQELKLPAIGGPVSENGQEIAQAEPTVEPTVEPTQEPTVTPTIQPTETPATAVQTYTVVRGDTLWEIAQKFYGDGTKWHKIFDANSLSMYSVDGHAFPLIHAGNILVIPE